MVTLMPFLAAAGDYPHLFPGGCRWKQFAMHRRIAFQEEFKCGPWLRSANTSGQVQKDPYHDSPGSTKTLHLACHPAHRATKASRQCIGMAASLDVAPHNCKSLQWWSGLEMRNRHRVVLLRVRPKLPSPDDS